MGMYYFNKHYEGECVMRSGQVNRVVNVRLSDEEIEIIRKYSRNRSLSYGLRTIIHKIDEINKSNT